MTQNNPPLDSSSLKETQRLTTYLHGGFGFSCSEERHSPIYRSQRFPSFAVFACENRCSFAEEFERFLRLVLLAHGNSVVGYGPAGFERHSQLIESLLRAKLQRFSH